MMLLFFFFKQKTAYEMRISDWSSDVCSSDLDHVARPIEAAVPFVGRQRPLGNTILRRIVAIVEKVTLVKPGDDRETADTLVDLHQRDRSEERRVGKEGVSTCRSRWSPYT